MNTKILVTGAHVARLPIHSVQALNPFQAMVIGSPLHSGKWTPDAQMTGR